MGALRDGLSPEVRSDTTFVGDAKLLFRDSGLYIQSDVDGSIRINVDGASGNTLKIYLGDKAALARVALYDSDGFPMTEFDSDGNIRQKGITRRTLTGTTPP